MNDRKRSPRVVVVGSLVFDLVAWVDQRPGKGETRLGKDFGMFPGGKGANQAVQVARMGSEVVMVGRVGDDLFGEEMLQSLQSHGVDTRFVRKDPSTTTAVGCITVDETGDNSIVMVPQANMKMTPADVSDALSSEQRADLLLLQLEIPLEVNIRAAELARQKGWTVILNPAPAQPLPDRLLSLADYLTPNEIELAMLVGKELKNQEEYRQAARSLLRHSIRGVIVTLGEQGALVVTHDEETLHPAFRINAVDTTAAGDAFTGTLAVALAEKKTLSEGIRLANAAGALAATKPGAQPSLASREEIETMAREGQRG